MAKEIKLKEPSPGIPYNIKLKIDNGKLFIEVDLKQEIGLSSSGKSMVVASSRGSLMLYPFTSTEKDKTEFGAYRVNLNCYKPRIQ